jgi:hypothetical protein
MKILKKVGIRVLEYPGKANINGIVTPNSIKKPFDDSSGWDSH